VVYDILQILNRRFPNIDIEIIPVKVQGHGAEKEIVSAIKLLNLRKKADVAIIARGGGSLEDLQAFNSEQVARAIFDSAIPIISAVGHETDFTIADFVADFRAPTPSAAAELVVPLKDELRRNIQKYRFELLDEFNRYLHQIRALLRNVSVRLVDPKRKIYDFRLRIDDDMGRLNRIIFNLTLRYRERFGWRNDRLFTASPLSYINTLRKTLDEINYKLFKLLLLYFNNQRFKINNLTSKLGALNPRAILDRGYSITRTIPDAVVVRDVQSVTLDQNLEVLLAKGSIRCRVKRKFKDAEENL
jgi:exodeoxyribonuclease VII large subunit